jgi:VWFA-related protein
MIAAARFQFCAMFYLALCGAGVARGAALPPAQPDIAIFHSGTHLVEVEVVVRDKSGTGPRLFGPPGAPVKGLTKDDFTLFDEGKPQPIAVFRVGSAIAAPAVESVLPPGAVSNRLDSRGQPLNGVTVVLIDQLNTHFDLKGYEHLGVTRLLRSLSETDRIALYSLGKDLRVLQDFTDDPQKLTAAIAKLDQGLIPVDPATIVRDGDDQVGWADWAEDRGKMTLQAVKRIVQHLSGVPGRKNLVWLEDEPVPAAVAGMLREANIAIYPVLVRAVGVALATKSAGGHFTEELAREHAAQNLAAATGGAAFFDVMDLTSAVRTAEEDSRAAYVLGFYPDDDALDGRFHNITVKLRKKASEASYRPGYLAAKPANEELVESPLNSTGVGLTAQLQPDPAHPGLLQIHLTVDLHDVRLEPRDGRMAGALDFLVVIPASDSPRSGSIQISFPQTQLAQALESGFTLNIGGIDSQTGASETGAAQAGELRVAVRDRSTGVAGSVRISIENHGIDNHGIDKYGAK